MVHPGGFEPPTARFRSRVLYPAGAKDAVVLI